MGLPDHQRHIALDVRLRRASRQLLKFNLFKFQTRPGSGAPGPSKQAQTCCCPAESESSLP
jgi:hypothetical protein